MSKTVKTILWAGCCLIPFNSSLAVELIIPSHVSSSLDRHMLRSYSAYPLDTKDGKKIGDTFKNWVLQTIDFDVATPRQSDRFGGRVTYYQELTKNIPIFIPPKPGLFVPDRQGLSSTKPVPVVYRSSPNRFSFRKLLDVEAKRQVEQDYAVEVVGAFLKAQGLLNTTQFDKIQKTSCYQLREKRAPHGGLPEQDVLILQKVKYSRQFGNAPVINSSISVDFHPDNLEILGFKHYNWTPANEAAPVPIPRGQMKTRDQVEQGLKDKIEEFWSASQKATLTSVTPAWFETSTELIPIVICQLEREDTGRPDVCTSFVNLSGSDSVFLPSPQVPAAQAYTTDCFPKTNPRYEDWLALGAPSCWCWPYQCDGDADGLTSRFPFNYRVFTGDLRLIVDNWRKKMDDPAFNPCADVSHQDSGFPFHYRVFTDDLRIIVDNWKKENKQLPGNCPR